MLNNGGSFELVSRSRVRAAAIAPTPWSSTRLKNFPPTLTPRWVCDIASANPQEIMLGTPPGPNADGEIWTRTRNAGLLGTDPRLAWIEWGCVGGADLDDRVIGPQAIPR